ncbi:expansin-like b1 [Phtheirospermum japonicum]|uniref:Expansin-like b1 n=1 Tax=Phtheirospermum japonicum TaxID=374723 RepID=A0A830CHB0_9LAMI|nr:expansin-like b1 [Phtheirospermum japonicum]
MGSNLVFSKFKNIVYILVVASLSHGDDGYICSRATYYGSPECLGNPTCGFGEYGRTVNNGMVSGVSRLYRNGSGCGACYQVRCKIPGLCSEDGTKVLVTDYGEGHYTDFIVSVNGFASLAASPNTAPQLFAYGVVDVEYRRIPCVHVGYNLMLKVHEKSSWPSYLAIVPVYQGGVYDVIGVQVWVEECKDWRGMRRVYGVVWDMENPPPAITNIRMQLTSDGQPVKWVEMPNVIPTYWKPGVAYDTGFQL